jgi:hypothetical protein
MKKRKKHEKWVRYYPEIRGFFEKTQKSRFFAKTSKIGPKKPQKTLKKPPKNPENRQKRAKNPVFGPKRAVLLR